MTNARTDSSYFNIFTISRCTRKCPECIQRGWTSKHADYELSLEDLTKWIDCTKESNYRYAVIQLSGGEPLLWKHREEGSRLLRDANIGPLMMFSNADRIENVTDHLMDSLSTLRLSRYEGNAKNIELLQVRYGKKVQVVDRKQHFPIPKKLAGRECLPAHCGCLGVALYGDKLYGCSLLITVAEEFGLDLLQYPESQCDIQVGYLEKLAGFPRKQHDCCRGCTGNYNLRHHSIPST